MTKTKLYAGLALTSTLILSAEVHASANTAPTNTINLNDQNNEVENSHTALLPSATDATFFDSNTNKQVSENAGSKPLATIDNFSVKTTGSRDLPLSETQDRENKTFSVILNTLAYLPGFQKESLGKTVYDWAKTYTLTEEDYQHMASISVTRAELNQIQSGILAQPEVYANMKVLDVNLQPTPNKLRNQNSAQFALSYNNALIILYRGTDAEYEWFMDAAGAGSSDTEAQIQALTYFDKIINKCGSQYKDIYVTGHSKGGNESMYVGVLRGNKISKVYSIDGTGFSDAFIKKYAVEINKNSDKIMNLNGDSDIVNILMRPVTSNFEFVKTNPDYGFLDGFFFQNPITSIRGNQVSYLGKPIYKRIAGLHMTNELFAYDKNGKFVLQPTTNQDPLMKAVHQFITTGQDLMDDVEFESLAETLIHLFIQPANWDLYEWTPLQISAIPKLILTALMVMAVHPDIIVNMPAILLSLTDFLNFVS